MRRSKAEVYLHLVWTTYQRIPWLTPDLTPPVYGCIAGLAKRNGAEILALGGMPDHVHLVVKLSPKTAISLLAQQIKGASSRLAATLNKPQEPFQWQEGYGVFSVSRSHLERVIAYVENQVTRHTSGKVWADWEETDEQA